MKKKMCVQTVLDRLEKIPEIRRGMTRIEVESYTIFRHEYEELLDMFERHLEDSGYPGNSYLFLLVDRVQWLKNAYEHAHTDVDRMFFLLSYETANSVLDYLSAMDYI